jgi:HTH-type transcriptional regulator/antitoxin HigA
MATDTVIQSDLPIPPGEYLEEVLEEYGMTKDELARRMQRPASKLSRIFSGVKAITPETALQLETVLGVPAHVWTSLEAQYRLALARREQSEQAELLKEEVALVKRFCYAELAQLGAVPESVGPLEKVQAMRRFFGVSRLTLVEGVRDYQPAFRIGAARANAPSPHAIAAWLRFGELKARSIRCAPFNSDALYRSLGTISELTRKNPSTYHSVLQKTLAAAGVALVLCEHFPGTRAHGATFRMHKGKAVLMITPRGAYADIFFFSLFHEIGHLLLHRGDEMIIEANDPGKTNMRREEEADRFAADALIDAESYRLFTEAGSFMRAEIEDFARKIGVHPGVVVGRLQHDELLAHNQHNTLRLRMKLSVSEG